MNGTGRCERCGEPFDDHILPKLPPPGHKWAYAGSFVKPVCVPDRKRARG